jgi:hypothetical protein
MDRREALRGIVGTAGMLTLGCGRSISAHQAGGVLFAPLMTLRLELAGDSIVGGAFDGARLCGTVLPGGTHLAITRPDGVLAFELRATLETDDGARIEVAMEGVHSIAYVRTVSHFEAPAAYAFLNRTFAVGHVDQRDGLQLHSLDELL